MDALLTQGYGHGSTGSVPPGLRTTPEAETGRAATVFAAIYLALVLCAPFIVRYGPSTDDHAMAALATRIEQPRCLSAPEFGYPCPGRTPVARDVRPAREPDL